MITSHLTRLQLASRALGRALSLCALGAVAQGQVDRAWVDDYDSGSWFERTTEDLVPFPGGGVVASSTGAGSTVHPPGEAVIRRLSENGDLIWEVSRDLSFQDYIGYPYREYRADTAVGPAGEVALAIGSAGPMRIRMYGAGGGLRWTASFSPVVGPHFEGATVEVAPNGDVVLATVERLFDGGETQRFGLYRFAAADGSLLWTRGAPASLNVHMALDSVGNALLVVDRDSTGQGNNQLDRFDPAGVLTGSVPLPPNVTNHGIVGIAVDENDRAVIAMANSTSSYLVSVDSAMAVE